ncbi:integrase [Streptomyces sp. NPDC058674]|uniref:integrase n=1 Tax=Streptomyces sp. NPDC058674 TaxID=3346592 RepID=UPI003648E68F
MGGTVARRGSGAGGGTAAGLGGTLTPVPVPVPVPGPAAVAGPCQDLSPAARAAMAEGIPAETARGYAGDRARFEEWALSAGFPAMPARAETLAEYATWLTVTLRPRTGRPYKPSSIDRALAAIVVAHHAAGRTPPGQTDARLVLKGYQADLKLTKDPRGKKRRANAATPAVLRRMIAATDPTTLIGLRDATARLLGFAIAAHSSEAALLAWEDIIEPEDDEGIAVEVYRPKVTNEQPLGVPCGSYPSSCPVRTLRAYGQALLDHGHSPTGPLLVRIDLHGRVNPPVFRNGHRIGDPSGRMTREGVGDIVTRTARRAGLLQRPDALLPDLPARWTGHALRRGYAEATRKAKKDMLEAARHGGWVDGSKAFAGYHDRAAAFDEDLNPLFGIGL